MPTLSATVILAFPFSWFLLVAVIWTTPKVQMETFSLNRPGRGNLAKWAFWPQNQVKFVQNSKMQAEYIFPVFCLLISHEIIYCILP